MLLLFLLLAVVAASSKVENSCNPQEDLNCNFRNPALAGIVYEPLAVEPSLLSNIGDPETLEYNEEGLHLVMKERFHNPFIISNRYIMYGKAEIEIKTAPGRGIVLSFYLQSDDGDEIDIVEAFGSDSARYLTNFFVKGNTTTYDRGMYHLTPVPPMNEYHKYGVEWTPQQITWTLDDGIVRVLPSDNVHGYPSSPMRMSLSLWAGGDSQNDQGTIEWAGGTTDYAILPISMYARNLLLQDYSSATTYTYGYKNGIWQHVQSDGIIEPGKPEIDISDTPQEEEEDPEPRKFIQFISTYSSPSPPLSLSLPTLVIWCLMLLHLY